MHDDITGWYVGIIVTVLQRAAGARNFPPYLVILAKKVHERIVGPWSENVRLESQHCIVRRVSSA